MVARFAKTALVPCLPVTMAVVNTAPAAAQEAGEVKASFSGIPATKSPGSSRRLHNRPGAAYRCLP